MQIKNEIGYMQVHIRLYKNSVLYDEFAFNVFDKKHQVKTNLVIVEFKANEEKCTELLVKILEDNYTISMLIPFHQSTEWEIVTISEEYVVGFYCLTN